VVDYGVIMAWMLRCSFAFPDPGGGEQLAV
jgi:hypothetical protein